MLLSLGGGHQGFYLMTQRRGCHLFTELRNTQCNQDSAENASYSWAYWLHRNSLYVSGKSDPAALEENIYSFLPCKHLRRWSGRLACTHRPDHLREQHQQSGAADLHQSFSTQHRRFPCVQTTYPEGLILASLECSEFGGHERGTNHIRLWASFHRRR